MITCDKTGNCNVNVLYTTQRPYMYIDASKEALVTDFIYFFHDLYCVHTGRFAIPPSYDMIEKT